jgi:hypothetical protein
MKIIVQSGDGKEYPVRITPKCRLQSVVSAICAPLNLPVVLGEISVGDSRYGQYRTLKEMDISEGDVVIFDICPLGEMILKQKSTSPSIFEEAISYVESISFTQLERNITTTFLSEVKRTMDGSRENREKSGALKRLILSIAFRGVISCEIWKNNSFDGIFKESGMLTQLEEESKMIVKGEGGCPQKVEIEKEETVLSYVLLIKNVSLSDSSFGKKLCTFLFGCVERMMKSGEKGERGMRMCLGLEGLCEGFIHLFLSPLFLPS